LAERALGAAVLEEVLDPARLREARPLAWLFTPTATP
jgi:hypothetical protein